MNKLGEAIKTIAAVIGVGMVIYHAGGTVAGKADANDVNETKTRTSVLETRVDELNSKVDRILEILEDR